MIFACYNGTGKTWLAERREDVLDLNFIPYLYKFPADTSREEVDKAEIGSVPYNFNANGDYAYVAEIKKTLPQYKHILILSDWLVMRDLEIECGPVEFWIIMPDCTNPNMKETYRKRFVERGNKKNFLDSFIDLWDMQLSFLLMQSAPKILLGEDQYVSDAIAAYENGKLVLCDAKSCLSPLVGDMIEYGFNKANSKFYRIND